MQPFVRNMLNRQRKRVVASILQRAENTFYDRLSEAERQEFRSCVLGAVAQYHDTCLDLVASSVTDGMMLNDDALRVLAEFNDRSRRAAMVGRPDV